MRPSSCMAHSTTWLVRRMEQSTLETTLSLKSFQCWILMESLLGTTDALYPAKTWTANGQLAIQSSSLRILPQRWWWERLLRVVTFSSTVTITATQGRKTFSCTDVLTRRQIVWRSAYSLSSSIKTLRTSASTTAISLSRNLGSQLQEWSCGENST